MQLTEHTKKPKHNPFCPMSGKGQQVHGCDFCRKLKEQERRPYHAVADDLK